MKLGHGWKIAWSAAVVVIALFSSTAFWFHWTLPFEVERLGAHTMKVEPMPGIAFPAGLIPGETIDLAAQDTATRTAILVKSEGSLAIGATYFLTVQRQQGVVRIPVSTTMIPANTTVVVTRAAEGSLADLLLCAMALLLLWRGEGLASLGLALYCTSYLIGDASIIAFLGGAWALAMICINAIGYAGARVGLFVMVDALVGERLSVGVRRLFRWGFVLLLAFGFAVRMGRFMTFIFAGSAEYLAPPYSLPFSSVYLVPFALLVIGYLRVAPEMRLRLRWMLVGVIALMATVVINNAILEPSLPVQTINNGFYAFSIIAMAYALLRHRVADFSIVIDRTLVYGATATVVIGVISAVEGIAQDAALGRNASLALQAGVSLGLGIALVALHKRLDALVERLFFRRRYKAGQALRNFAGKCAFIEHESTLLDRAIHLLKQHTHAPGVALYEREDSGYAALRQFPHGHYPHAINIDDPVAVALRAGDNEVGLLEIGSTLGNDGYAFPMTVRGNLLGFTVIAHRPSEHYSKEERTLLAHVVHEVGIALFAARARSQAEFLRESIDDTALPEPWRVRARKLILGAREA